MLVPLAFLAVLLHPGVRGFLTVLKHQVSVAWMVRSNEHPLIRRPLGDDVYALMGSLRDTPVGPSISNGGFIVDPAGVVLVDCFLTPGLAQAALESVAEVTDIPVRWVVQSHWHLDHTGGSAAFKEQPDIIVAHVRTTESLRRMNPAARAGFASSIRSAGYDATAIEDMELVVPGTTFVDQLVLPTEDHHVEVRWFGRGHTAGDAVVVVKDAGVAMVGDLFVHGAFPSMSFEGYPREWIGTLEALEDLEMAVYLPGHGLPGDGVDLRRFRGYLETLVYEVEGLLAAGVAPEDMASGVRLPWFTRAWGARHFFSGNVTRVYNTLTGLRWVPPRTEREEGRR